LIILGCSNEGLGLSSFLSSFNLNVDLSLVVFYDVSLVPESAPSGWNDLIWSSLRLLLRPDLYGSFESSDKT